MAPTPQAATRAKQFSSEERLARLKRFARASAELERARREFLAALVQVFQAGWSVAALQRFHPWSEDAYHRALRKMREGKNLNQIYFRGEEK